MTEKYQPLLQSRVVDPAPGPGRIRNRNSKNGRLLIRIKKRNPGLLFEGRNQARFFSTFVEKMKMKVPKKPIILFLDYKLNICAPPAATIMYAGGKNFKDRWGERDNRNVHYIPLYKIQKVRS